MSERIAPRWSESQVKALNEYQNSGWMHPFTCLHHNDPSHHDHPTLRATADGWVCDACDYTQAWAWTFMAQPRSTP